MIKTELIEAIRVRLGGVSSRDVGDYVAFVFEDIARSLEAEESVKITNFGVWETHDKKARIGRNPKTLEEAEISARRVIRFRMSKVLANAMNSEFFSSTGACNKSPDN